MDLYPGIGDVNISGETLLVILVVLAIIALVLWIIGRQPWIRR